MLHLGNPNGLQSIYPAYQFISVAFYSIGPFRSKKIADVIRFYFADDRPVIARLDPFTMFRYIGWSQMNKRSPISVPGVHKPYLQLKKSAENKRT